MTPAVKAGASPALEVALDPPLETAASTRSQAADYMELTKPGITRLVLLTTAVGFYMGSAGAVDWLLLLKALFGVALAAGGAGALNHYVERDVDALMERTRNRPLPAGRLSPARGRAFAVVLSALGLLHLALFVNLTTALVVGAIIASYILVYTPLKRRTSFATLVGGVPGALPIVAGWTASGAALSAQALALFGILFLWQIPHFLALAWVYRDDYRRGGFVMLTLTDPDGRTTGRQATLYGLSLLPVSLLPTLIGITGAFYFYGALVVGVAFLAVAAPMVVRPTERRAWRLFASSVIYLPALLLLMVADRALL